MLVIVNESMRIEWEDFLGAETYEHTEERREDSNGYKSRTVKTRVGEEIFDIPPGT